MKKDEHYKNVIKTMLDTAMLASAMRHIPEYDADDLCIIFLCDLLEKGSSARDGDDGERVSVVVAEEILEIGHRDFCRGPCCAATAAAVDEIAY